VSQGIGLALALIGLSWLTARSMLPTTADDEYASVSSGKEEVAPQTRPQREPR